MMIAQISVSPNPFINVIEIKIKGEENKTCDCIIRLIDQKGSIVRMIGISLIEGTNKIFIDRLKQLSPGNYFLDIKNTSNENIFSTKLVKE